MHHTPLSEGILKWRSNTFLPASFIQEPKAAPPAAVPIRKTNPTTGFRPPLLSLVKRTAASTDGLLAISDLYHDRRRPRWDVVDCFDVHSRLGVGHGEGGTSMPP